MDETNDMDHGQIIKELRDDADEATWYLGSTKTFIADAEAIARRFEGSWSGYAGVTAKATTKIALVMYCARAWDHPRDRRDNPMSIPCAIERLPWLEGAKQGDRPPSLEKKYEALQKVYKDAEAKACQPDIRLLRTELFAHRLIESDDRRKFLRAGEDITPSTYSDLIDLTEATLNLVGQVGYLWDRVANPYPERIKYTTECCREFWRHVPVLKTVEQPRP